MFYDGRIWVGTSGGERDAAGRAGKKAVGSVARTAAGTIGRELGNETGKRDTGHIVWKMKHEMKKSEDRQKP